MGLFRKAKSVLVVDTAAILKTKGVRGRAAPRQQLQILRSLSRIVQREKLNVTAVFVGAPLDKAPHDKVFEGVRVRYAKSENVLGSELLKALKQAGSAGVLVTDDAALESKVIRAGGTTLRVSTFRKLLDDGSEQGEGGGGSNVGNRQQRGRRDRGPRPDRGGTPPPQPQAEEDDEEEQRGGDTISQMIDLVE